MAFLWDSIIEAVKLLFTADNDVYYLIGTSFGISIVSTMISLLIGFPLGVIFGVSDFKAKSTVDVILNTVLFLPTVVVGHLVYMFLTHKGPLGEYRLLFTPAAIVVGQIILATPIIIAMIANAIRVADKRILYTAFSLGVGRLKAYWILLGEIREIVLLSAVAAFGRVIAEVGVSMMLGGNIYGKTRTITTGIALLTKQGEFAKANALGIVLVIIVLAVNILVYRAVKKA